MSTPGNRPLIYIIAVLLLTNIAVLAYFLWFKKDDKTNEGGRSKRPPGIESQLKEEVGFNEDQLVKYRSFRDEQMKAVKPMFDEIRKAKDSFYTLIGSGMANDSVVNSMADVIAQKQKVMDLRMFYHFRRIRDLCRPEQRSKYDSLIQRMMRKMGGRSPRKDKDKKEDK